VVVAACSARALEPIVKGSMGRGLLPINLPGVKALNAYTGNEDGCNLKIVNLIDHGVRLYRNNPGRATSKAQDLIRMAVASLKVAPPPVVEKVTITPAALV